MPRKKPKFEKLWIHGLRWGELKSWTAYDAPEAARIAAKQAKEGWSIKVESRAGRTPFMKCDPNQRVSSRDRPSSKIHAVCTMTPAFKKRVRGR